MALVNRSFSVNVTPGMMPTFVHVSEYDVGRAYTVSILDEQGNTFTIPSGTTASIEGTLNGSVGFTQSATVSNNQVSFTLSQSMTAYSGKAWCKIKLTQNSQPIQTCAFILSVDRAGVEAGTVIGAPGFEEQIQTAVDNYLEEHPVGVEVDHTLSVEGAAADAKVTGDEIGELKSALNDITVERVNILDLSNIVVSSENASVSVSEGVVSYTSTGINFYIKIPIVGVEYGETYDFSVTTNNGLSLRSNPSVNEISDISTTGTQIAVSGNKSGDAYSGTFSIASGEHDKTKLYLVCYANYTPSSGSFTPYVCVEQLTIKRTALGEEVNGILAEVEGIAEELDSVLVDPSNAIDFSGITKTDSAGVSVSDGVVSYTSGGANGYINIPINNVKIGTEYLVKVKMTGSLSLRSVPKIYYRIDPTPSVNGTMIDSLDALADGEYNGSFTITQESGIPATNIFLVCNINYTPSSGSFTPTVIQNTGKEIANDKLSYPVQMELGIDGNPLHYRGKGITAFTKIACIGDSITNGVFNYGSGGAQTIAIPKYSYPSILKKITGIETENMGHGGYTSVGWYNEFGDTDFTGYDCAIIELGINDALQSISISDSKTAIQNIINKLKTDVNNIKIFIASITPAYSDAVHTFDAIDEALIELVGSNTNVYYLNSKTYSDVRKGTKYVQGHLTAEGYFKYAQEMAAGISYIIESNPSEFKDIQFIGTSYSYT